MVKKLFSKTWNRSIQPRKQRKYRYNAPLHIKQRMLHVHLSPELRKKHNQRNALVKTGDKVKVLKGKFKNKEGKVERVDLKRGKIFVTGVELVKKDGTKVILGLNHSNIMITVLDLDSRKKMFEKKKKEIKENEPKLEPEIKLQKELLQKGLGGER